MTFIKWLIDTYKNEDSPKGDLARDVIDDRKNNNFRGISYNSLIKRMESLGGSSHIIQIAKDINEIYKNIKN